MSKTIYLLLAIIIVSIMSGCAPKKDITIGLTENNGKVGNIVQKVPVNIGVYVEYTQDTSFDADSVEYEIDRGDYTVSGGSSLVNKQDKAVIIPMTFPESGTYQIKIMIKDNMVFQKFVSTP